MSENTETTAAVETQPSAEAAQSWPPKFGANTDLQGLAAELGLIEQSRQSEGEAASADPDEPAAEQAEQAEAGADAPEDATEAPEPSASRQALEKYLAAKKAKRQAEEKPAPQEPAPRDPRTEQILAAVDKFKEQGGPEGIANLAQHLGMSVTELINHALDARDSESTPPDAGEMTTKELEGLKKEFEDLREELSRERYERELQEASQYVSSLLAADTDGRWELLQALPVDRIVRSAEAFASQNNVDSLEAVFDIFEGTLEEEYEKRLQVSRKSKKFQKYFKDVDSKPATKAPPAAPAPRRLGSDTGGSTAKDFDPLALSTADFIKLYQDGKLPKS